MTDNNPKPVRIGAVLLGVVVVEATFFVLAAITLLFMTLQSRAFENVALALGTIATAIGAYVGARFAKRSYTLHAWLITAVVFAISFVRFVAFQLRPPADGVGLHPMSWEISGWILLAIAGYVAVRLANRRAK